MQARFTAASEVPHIPQIRIHMYTTGNYILSYMGGFSPYPKPADLDKNNELVKQ